MKKILYIVSTLKRSGPTNMLYNLIKYLDRDYFEPYLITLSPEPTRSRWSDFVALGVHLYSLKLSRLKRLFFNKRHIGSLFFEIMPDLVHTCGIRSDIIFASLNITTPQINTIRNFPQYDYIMTYGPILGNLMCIQHIKILDKMAACIAVSQAVADNLITNFNISNVIPIQNGVDTDIFFPSKEGEKVNLRKRLNLPLTGKFFICSGHLSALKNPIFLIENWKKLFRGNDDKHLVFIGSGKLKDNCEYYSKSHKNIHIIGRVENVVDYLRASDYLISASRTEGFPNAVLEAMACGLPVLLSDIPSHKEIIDIAPNAGLCYELGNKINFCEFLNKLISINWTTMSSAALKFIRETANASVMARDYQKIYQKVTT